MCTGIFMICVHRFLFAATKGTFTGLQLVSLQDDYLQEAKEHVLVCNWPLSKVIIYRRQKNIYWCTAGLFPR